LYAETNSVSYRQWDEMKSIPSEDNYHPTICRWMEVVIFIRFAGERSLTLSFANSGPEKPHLMKEKFTEYGQETTRYEKE